jgi:hypothetical protein
VDARVVGPGPGADARRGKLATIHVTFQPVRALLLIRRQKGPESCVYCAISSLPICCPPSCWPAWCLPSGREMSMVVDRLRRSTRYGLATPGWLPHRRPRRLPDYAT